MGETRIHFKVYGDHGQVAELEAVVDTGSTFSKIPESVAARLGLEAKYETDVELGDGRVIKRKLALVEIEIEEVRRPVLITIGEEERPLVGYTALELLGFKVNPITRKLEKAVPIEYTEREGNDYVRGYKGKSILVTGGAGCIGSNLVKALIKAEAAKIIALDDLSSSERWNVPGGSSVVFVHGSILNEEVLKRVFTQGFDFVFHLATHFANQNSVEHPETDLMVNGLGTLKVLQYSQLTKVPKFIFASSGCSVYGSQAPLPLKEDFVSLHLDTPYQITKLLGELYCNFFHNYYGLPVVICRYFNVYGPGEIPGKYRNVIPNFIYWALHQKPLPITGTGDETRDFTFVDDVVNGTLRAGAVPEAVGEAFNLASETETKIIDIANTVNEITGNHNGVQFLPRRDWDRIILRRASIDKARKVLGYEPRTKIKDGIKMTFDWFVQNRNRIETSVRF